MRANVILLLTSSFGLAACGGTTPTAAGTAGSAGTSGGQSQGGASNSSGGQGGGGTPSGGQGSSGTSSGGQASSGAPSGGSAGTSTGGSGAGGGGGQAQAGAGSGGTNSGGHAGVAGSGMGGSTGGKTLADVQVIFDARCVLCHDKSKVGLPTYPALSLVQGDSRAALVNRDALETCGGKYVVPGDPAHSYLMHKLTDATPCSGAHMPAPFEIIKPPPLSASDLATIESWIAGGAQ